MLNTYNPLKKKLNSGEVVFGPWCTVPSSFLVHTISSAGVDFVIVDMEHGPCGFETAYDLVSAAQSAGSSSIIRLSDRSESTILKALDCGADGILVPHIKSRRDAEMVVSYAKYHPKGQRGFSPYTRAGGYGTGHIEGYAERENDRTMVGVILEGREGISNIDEMLDVEDIDLIYVGAYDLSQALGMPGQVTHPKVMDAMKTCVRRSRESGISVGGHVAKTTDDIKWMIDMGMQFVTMLPDVAVISDLFSGWTRTFKEISRERRK